MPLQLSKASVHSTQKLGVQALIGIFCVRIYSPVPSHAMKFADPYVLVIYPPDFRAFEMLLELLNEQLQNKDIMPLPLSSALASCVLARHAQHAHACSVFELFTALRWDSHGRVSVLESFQASIGLSGHGARAGRHIRLLQERTAVCHHPHDCGLLRRMQPTAEAACSSDCPACSATSCCWRRRA